MSEPRSGRKLSYSIKIALRHIPRMYWMLSSAEFLFWFATATTTYLTVFLQRAGYKPAQVGFINAVSSVVTICATPFWGMMADKFRSVRKIFVFCTLIASITWALIPISAKIIFGPVVLLQIIIPFGAAFRSPANSLMDAFVVQTSARERLQYGRIRLWGSLSFTIMNLSLSAVLPWTGVDISFYIYGLAFIPLMYLMWNLKGVDGSSIGYKDKSVSFRELGLGRLLKNYYFVTYLIFALILYIPVNTTYTFLPFLVDNVGGNTAKLGLVAGYKALLEIPMLLSMRAIMRKFSFTAAILLACVFYMTEAVLYTRAGSLTHILLIQTFEGLGGGLMIGAAANYIFSMTPDGLKSTAQTILGAVSAVAGILGNIAGGNLIGLIGIKQYYLVSAVIIFFALLFLSFTLLFGVKVLKKAVPRFDGY